MAASLLLFLLQSRPALAVGEPVLEPVPEGRIDWTRMVLQVEAESELRIGAWKDRRIQEQDALDRLGPRVERLAQRVRLTPDTLAADLLSGQGDLARRLQETVDDWEVVETRYRDSGVVHMTAELDLRAWLRPALSSLTTTSRPPDGPGQATGIVVDARELPFEPCLAPRLSTPSGSVLVGAQRLSSQAVELESPVVYVSDPADPLAVERAGDSPLLVRAASVQGGGELVLDPTSARLLEQHPDTAGLAARGRVVVVTRSQH